MAKTQDLRFVGTLIANTLDARYGGKGVDQIHKNVPLLAGLMGPNSRAVDLGMGKGIKPYRGGNKIRVTVIESENPNFKWYDKFETLLAQTSDEETDAFEVMRNASAMVGVDGPSLDENRGTAQVRDIVREKVDEMERTFREKLEIALMQGKVGTTGTNPTYRHQPLDKAPNPIGYLIQKNAAANSDLVHELNQVTNTWWRNQVLLSTANSFSTFFKQLNNVYMATQLQGDVSTPDLGMCDTYVYETMEAMLFEKQRFQPFGQSSADGESPGFPNVKFKDTYFYASSYMPNLGANATAAVTLTPANTTGVAMFLNTRFIKLHVSDRRNMDVGEPREPIEQDAIWIKMLGRYQFITESRRKLGVLYGIDTTGINA